MKVMTMILALLTSTAALAETQLVFMADYQGFNRYSSKTISTLEASQPLALLINAPETKTALCFNGDEVEAALIVEKMVAQESTAQMAGYAFVRDEESVGEPVIIVDLKFSRLGEDGRIWTYTLPKLRPCSRVSKSSAK